MALGYTRLDNEPEGHDTGALGRLAVRHFAPWNATLLAYELPSVHSAEIVVLAHLTNTPPTGVTEHIDSFTAEIRAASDAILSAKSKTHISLRIAFFAYEAHEVDALRRNLSRRSGSISLRLHTGGFWKKRKVANLKWRTYIVDIKNASVHQSARLRFDVITHELQIAAKQAGSATAGESAVDYSIASFLAALTGEVVNYFAILLAFVQNRLVFADLIVNKRYPPERIVGYYVIGIGVSVVLPYVFTLGRVGPGEL